MKVTIRLLYISRKLNGSPSVSSGMSIRWKELSCQAKQRHGGTLNAYGLVEKASLEKLHTIWFQLYDFGKGKTTERVKRSVAARASGEAG